jgi:hypothetical protein
MATSVPISNKGPFKVPCRPPARCFIVISVTSDRLPPPILNRTGFLSSSGGRRCDYSALRPARTSPCCETREPTCRPIVRHIDQGLVAASLRQNAIRLCTRLARACGRLHRRAGSYFGFIDFPHNRQLNRSSASSSLSSNRTTPPRLAPRLSAPRPAPASSLPRRRTRHQSGRTRKCHSPPLSVTSASVIHMGASTIFMVSMFLIDVAAYAARIVA